jgi:hypothetical protein
MEEQLKIDLDRLFGGRSYPRELVKYIQQREKQLREELISYKNRYIDDGK